tara:strand:- start:1564 stop:3396 length:1833 start_codon:yes stop_codon:yes gene_type:complete
VPEVNQKKILFPLLAICVGLLPLVLLEGIFRIFDFASPEQVVDTSSGFNEHQPLFSLNEDETTYLTTRNRALYFGDQTFKSLKPKATYRMFFLGGSTVRGRPFAVDSAFAKWIELELNHRSENTTYESINCGGLSYASFRLTNISREVLNYKPDLLVLATGHNEFLENRTFGLASRQADIRNAMESLRLVVWLRSLIGQDVESFKESSAERLPENVTARLDKESGYASYHWDPEWKQQVTQQYEESLLSIIKQCKSANVPLVLVCLGSNLRDCPPFKSELPPGLSAKDKQAFLTLFDQANKLAEQPEVALHRYEECLQISDQYALLHYRMARTLEQLGNTLLARKHYLLAKDFDICPLRLSERMDNIQRKLAKQYEVPLIDARTALENASTNKIPGYEMYVDHVHPTLEGHQIIAGAIVDNLIENKLVAPELNMDVREYQYLYSNYIQSLPLAFFSNGARRVNWLETWARRNLQLFELEPFDLRGSLAAVHRQLGFDRFEHAHHELDTTLQQYGNISVPVLQLALTFQRQGRYKVARTLLQWLEDNESNEVLLQQIQYARMINAESMGDRGVAILIYDNYFDRLPFEVAANANWREFIPDIWERVKLENQ